jgi:OmpA-OmpF porin, OOP family
MKKSYVAWLVLVLLAVSTAMAAAPVRHDSILFLNDVSWSVKSKGLVPPEKKIISGMAERFPGYVKSAGLMSFGQQCGKGYKWLLPVGAYDAQSFSSAANSIKSENGSTPLGFVLRKSDEGLKNSQGRTALVIVSDGMDNGDESAVGAIKTLKKKYGDNLCVFTIQVGVSAQGAKLLEELVKAGGCGKATKGSDLVSADQLQGLDDFIFPPEEAVAPPPPPKVVDTDGDGVLDDVDQCPNTPAGVKVDKRGCWVLSNINFDSGSAVIKAEYFPLLDEAVTVFKNNPGMNVAIEGHTDSDGSDESNQKLSQQRAESVMKYFVDKGVDAGRLTAEGFGESKPIAANDTAEGKAENRRIELKVK